MTDNWMDLQTVVTTIRANTYRWCYKTIEAWEFWKPASQLIMQVFHLGDIKELIELMPSSQGSALFGWGCSKNLWPHLISPSTFWCLSLWRLHTVQLMQNSLATLFSIICHARCTRGIHNYWYIVEEIRNCWRRRTWNRNKNLFQLASKAMDIGSIWIFIPYLSLHVIKFSSHVWLSVIALLSYSRNG
jgi:hypothetical protein